MKIARILQNSKETFGIINQNGKVVTREEIIDQTNLILPYDAEDFLFFGYARHIRDRNLSKLSFCHETQEFRFLPPIIKTFKIICLSFNYIDQGNWIRFGNHPPKGSRYLPKAKDKFDRPF